MVDLLCIYYGKMSDRGIVLSVMAKVLTEGIVLSVMAKGPTEGIFIHHGKEFIFICFTKGHL